MKKLLMTAGMLAGVFAFGEDAAKPATPAAAPAAATASVTMAARPVAAPKAMPGKPGYKGALPPAAMRRRMSPAARAEMMRRMQNRFVRPFGKTADGKTAKLYRLRGPDGLILDISDYGGRLVRCYAPDKFGNLADVTLGWNTAEEYDKYGFSCGTLIGRYGNRIAHGKFTLDGKEYQLPVNEAKDARHCNLHGGPQGWDKQIWTVSRVTPRSLELTYVSKDGEMGFPGTVTCKVTYKMLPGTAWSIDYEATTDKPTVINPTHHSYWNLAGEASGSVLGQELQIFADEYTQTDAGLIPTKNASVKGTGFDFTEMRAIGAKADLMKADKALAPMNNWYDHNFVLRGKAGVMRPACKMRDPVSGRTLEIRTTEPGMQMYGAQNMNTGVPAKTAGRSLCQYAGIALETQHYPDSPNHADFPSTVLRPGETFKSRTEYHFGISK